MPVKKDAWAPGTPAWVDLMAADFEASKSFYAQLFGWEYEQSGEEYGNYATALLDGESVAGIGPAQGPDAPPPTWTTYLAVDDAAKVAEQAADAGGTVLMPAMQVGSMGSMAVLADPTGAVFGLWQAGEHTGFNRYNEPGADVWNEAMVGDYRAGQDFYRTLFDYTYSEIGDGQMSYSTIEVEGNTVGGIGPVQGDVADLPPHWRTYFSVADVEQACAKAVELGGTVEVDPFDTPFGMMGGVRAPGGEVVMLSAPPKTPPADG